MRAPQARSTVILHLSRELTSSRCADKIGIRFAIHSSVKEPRPGSALRLHVAVGACGILEALVESSLGEQAGEWPVANGSRLRGTDQEGGYPPPTVKLCTASPPRHGPVRHQAALSLAGDKVDVFLNGRSICGVGPLNAVPCSS